MKKLIFVLFAFALLASAVSLAQDAAKPDDAQAYPQAKQEQKAADKTKTVTGCLQKGDEAGEFSITGEDGKSWELRSKTVKLEQHVGHQVTVTGTAHHETKAEEKKEGQMEKASGKEEYGDLRVTDLKMVSETCTK
jgi:hypothetical protein